jgi:cytoskeletal protein CcmA (bactofilin family)
MISTVAHPQRKVVRGTGSPYFGESMELGRISGPLLKSNLIRDGVDLAFETDLLYLAVNSARLGINTTTPQYDLDVNGTARTQDLTVTNQLNIGDFTITGNTISSTQNTINFQASGGEATIYHSRLIVNDIELSGNTIKTQNTNSNLELSASGTGIIDLQSSAEIDGNLHVTGNISADGNVNIGGNITIGNNVAQDNIYINAAIRSSLIPETTSLYDLGSNSQRWRNIYSANINADNLNLNTFNIGNLSFANTTITTTGSTDLILDPSGTGRVRMGHFAFYENTITNFVSGSVTEISHTANGYFQIAGTNAFIPPVGSSGQRPAIGTEVGGMMRYNTDSRAIEIYDPIASSWVSPSGTIGAISEGTANDISIVWALTLG